MKNTKSIINVDLIKKYIKTNNLTLNKFCKHCGVKYWTLKKILDNKINISFNDIAKIAFFMNLEIKDIFINN